MNLQFVKIRIHSENHSIKIQSYLFKEGFSWGGGLQEPMYTSARFLYTSAARIHFSELEEGFKEDENREIFYPPLKIKTLKE